MVNHNYSVAQAMHLCAYPTALDYWKMMMLEDILASIIFATNQQPEMRHHPLTYNKLHHFLGIILAMALAPKGDQRDL